MSIESNLTTRVTRAAITGIGKISTLYVYFYIQGVEDADFPEEEDEEEEDMDGDISDDSQESVSLLAEAKKHRYM